LHSSLECVASLCAGRKFLAFGKTKTEKRSTKGKKKFVSKKGNKNKDGFLDPYGKSENA
jgi:hypothetical protein